jgi:hypothetical protein
MIWIVASAVIFVVILLYSCVAAGAEADRNLKEIMKKSQRKD